MHSYFCIVLHLTSGERNDVQVLLVLRTSKPSRVVAPKSQSFTREKSKANTNTFSSFTSLSKKNIVSLSQIDFSNVTYLCTSFLECMKAKALLSCSAIFLQP